MSAIVINLKAGKPTKMTVVGVPGQQCHSVAKPFEAIMGGKVIDKKETAEAAMAEVQTSASAQIGG